MIQDVIDTIGFGLAIGVALIFVLLCMTISYLLLSGGGVI